MTDHERALAAEGRLIDRVPVAGQGLALDLVATEFILGGLRGHRVDALQSSGDAAQWLAAYGLADVLLSSADLTRIRGLRAAIRQVLDARFGEGVAVPAAARELLNSAANALDETWELDEDLTTVRVTRDAPTPAERVLGETARDALRILGDTRGFLHPCPAPACILYFWDETGRRRWCSAGCGIRVRVARHAATHGR